MTFTQNQPIDLGGIPTSSVYSPTNNDFGTLQGESGTYFDSTGVNKLNAAVMSFLRPRIVQSAHAVTGSGGKTLNCAFTNQNNQGNSIVTCVGMGEVEGANITLTITDTNGNTYSEAVNSSQSTTLESAIFYTTKPDGIAGGANTVTVTIAGSSSSNTAIGVEIYEVWGTIAVAGALDQTGTGSNAGSTSISTSAINVNAPNELVFVSIVATGGTITPGTNWTLDSGSLSPVGGNLVSFGAQSRLHTQILALTPTATLSASNTWAACTASFKSVIVPIEGAVTLVVAGQAVANTNPVPTQDIEQAGYIALSSPPAQTNAGSDTPLTFAQQVNRVIVMNNTTANVYYAFDTTASLGSLVVTPGNGFEWPKKITVLHLYTAAAQNINGTSVGSIVVLGAL